MASENEMVHQDPPPEESAPNQAGTHSMKKSRKRKGNKILHACRTRDIEALAEYASSEGGLLQDELRRVAWPILLGCDTNKSSSLSNGTSGTSLPSHGDEEQVKLDVDRAFVYYPRCADKELATMKEDLLDLITTVLRKNPGQSYFQGYHDIAQVLLLVLGREDAECAVERISLFRIRDYMLPSLSPALKHLQLLPAILDSADPKLSLHISGTKPFYALAAALTLYAHDIQEYGDIVRLYDFLLSHEPVISIYLFATIILSRKEELFAIDAHEPEMVHFTLTKLPQPLNLEPLILDSMSLYQTHPPESLPNRGWRKISPHSVLKTSRSLALNATQEDAKSLFEKQIQELRREERWQKVSALMRKHSRPIGSVGLAVFIGVVSYWIMRGDASAAPISRLFRLLRSAKDIIFVPRW